MDKVFRRSRLDWDAQLKSALDASDWLVLLASKRALESTSYVTREVEYFVGELWTRAAFAALFERPVAVADVVLRDPSSLLLLSADGQRLV